MAASVPAVAPPPLVLDPAADTLDHVVRAVAHSDFLPQAVRLMLASPEHHHDPELLYRTRGVRGAGGRTLLMRAVMRGNVARVAEILAACPTPAARAELLACVDAKGFVALHHACYHYQPEEAMLRLVELLLANGADPLAPQIDANKRTDVVWHAIHYAAQWSTRIVQRLVQAGASIDGDVGGDSTLWAAMFDTSTARRVRMIPRLVALGARETIGNRVMLTFAERSFEGSAQPTDAEVAAALNALVSVGCSLTQPGVDGRTPLDLAANSGNTPMVRALLSLGAPATTSSLVRGIEHPGIIRVLLAAGAPPSGPVALLGQDPLTPLMAAAAASALESMRLLLAAGASVNRRNKLGDTALVWAVRSRTDTAVTRVVEALLDAGADVRAQNNEGDAVLHLVARRHAKPWAVAAARLLLDGGADASAENKEGCAPAQLIPAAQRGEPLYLALIEAGA